jgi:transcriptional regulator with XRE-family HTH domain
MVSTMTEERPGQIPAKRERPGSGVPVSPEKLTWMRNNRKLTREQLSDRIAAVAREQHILDNHGDPVTYSRDAVAKLENGERKPKMYTFEALCAALECDPSELQEDFPGTGRTPPPAGMPSVAEVFAILGNSPAPIDVLMGELSTRAWNSVKVRSGCATIGELARASQDGTLEDTHNLGFVQLQEIRGVLARWAADRSAERSADADYRDPPAADDETGAEDAIAQAG